MPHLFGTSGWADALLTGVISLALRATVLLCAAWVATRLLRRASAATRHLIWTAAIAGVLTLPLLQASLPAWTVPVLPIRARIAAPPIGNEPRSEGQQPPTANASGSRRPSALPDVPAAAPITRATDSIPRTSVIETVLSSLALNTVLAVLWLTLAALLIARLAIANVRVSSWQRSSQPVEDPRWLALLRRLSREYGIERPVMLLENEETDVPVTWGVVYPVVLIPAATTEQWDEEQRIAVLTHELAHVKRFDAFTQLLAQLAAALLWFHPLVWMAVRRMRLEREHACDDFVLAAGARASRYADDLLALARGLTRPTAPAAAALAMARRSELEGRLLAILDPAAKRSTVRRAKVALLTAGVIVLATPLAAFRPGVRVSIDPVEAAVTPIQQDSVRTIAAMDHFVAPAAQRAEMKARVTKLTDRSRELDVLTKRLGAMMPGTLSMSSGFAGRARVRADTEPPRAIDLETLIDVTRAAKRMTSDHEKAELLILIAKRYQRNDALRDAYIDAVLTMTSDHDRSRALIAFLDRDSLPQSSVAQVLRSTAMMTSDVNKGQVLKRISPSLFADTVVQRAYLDAIVAMTSDVERGAAITQLMKQRPLTAAVQLALLQTTTVMTSNVEKANVLTLFLDRQGLADEKIRRAFFKVAETLTSDLEYRRIMTAVMK